MRGRGIGRTASADFGLLQRALATTLSEDDAFEVARMASRGPVEISAAAFVLAEAIGTSAKSLTKMGRDPKDLCADLISWRGAHAEVPAVTLPHLGSWYGMPEADRIVHDMQFGPDEVLALGVMAATLSRLIHEIGVNEQYEAAENA